MDKYICSKCGGHDLVEHGDVIQCHDCGHVVEEEDPEVVDAMNNHGQGELQ